MAAFLTGQHDLRHSLPPGVVVAGNNHEGEKLTRYN